jgi:hypothetical protein
MSILQSRAKSVVVSLARGEKLVIHPEAQRLLSAWIAMSAITSEFLNSNLVAISSSDRDWVRHRTSAPENWKIWIGNYQRNNWKPYRIRHALAVTEDETAEGPGIHDDGVATPNTQMTTLVFGRLYVHAISSTIPEVIKCLNFPNPVSAILAPIWPPRNAVLDWPLSQTMTDRDADSAAGFLFLSATDLLNKKPFRI